MQAAVGSRAASSRRARHGHDRPRRRARSCRSPRSAAAGARRRRRLRLRAPAPRRRSTRRVPYAFLVTRPGLASGARRAAAPDPDRRHAHAASRAPSVYRYPAAPFGPAPNYAGAPVDEDGAETLYVIRIDEPAVNVGAAVIASSAPGSLVDPWLLGSPDENDVQGYAGTPVNVNDLTFDYQLDVGAAGTVFPRTKAYYVAVDSGRDLFTGRSLGGRYVLARGSNDVQPPTARPAHDARRRRAADDRAARARPRLGRRPVLARDRLRQRLIGAAAYDPASGIALFPLPARRRRCRPASGSCRRPPPTSRRRRTSTPSATSCCRTPRSRAARSASSTGRR